MKKILYLENGILQIINLGDFFNGKSDEEIINHFNIENSILISQEDLIDKLEEVGATNEYFDCLISNEDFDFSIDLEKAKEVKKNALRIDRIEKLKEIDNQRLKVQDKILLNLPSDITLIELAQKAENLRNFPENQVWQDDLTIEEIKNINIEYFE